MIQSIQDILKRHAQGTVAQSVHRAMVIEAANIWLLQKQPKLKDRARVSSIVHEAMIIQCTSGVIANEVKRLSTGLLQEMQRQYPTFPVHSLKCFMQGGTLPSDEMTEETPDSSLLENFFEGSNE